jgi:hypothetical protein
MHLVFEKWALLAGPELTGGARVGLFQQSGMEVIRAQLV